MRNNRDTYVSHIRSPAWRFAAQYDNRSAIGVPFLKLNVTVNSIEKFHHIDCIISSKITARYKRYNEYLDPNI